MFLHQSRAAKDTVNAGRADGDGIGVEHHESEPPVSFEGMPGVEIKDGLLLPLFEPPIAGDHRVVLVGQTIAGAPVVELTGGDPEPTDELLDGDFGESRPASDVINDGVANVVGNPGGGQSSPNSFFSWICSSINSATTSFLRWSLSRSAAMVFWRD